MDGCGLGIGLGGSPPPTHPHMCVFVSQNLKLANYRVFEFLKLFENLSPLFLEPSNAIFNVFVIKNI